MKAVDFIVETPDKILFIEFKDLDHPKAKDKDRDVFIKELEAGAKDEELVRKYRDSFIYYWAMGSVRKPIVYYVLIACDKLDEAMLLNRTDALRRKLPVEGPDSWRRKIVESCGVFNIMTWNQHLPEYPVKREALDDE